jgi:hypothetical protein
MVAYIAVIAPAATRGVSAINSKLSYFAFNNTHDTNTYSICTDIAGIVVYWDKIERPCSGLCREVVLMDAR